MPHWRSASYPPQLRDVVRRVAITGIGAIAAIGNDAATCWRSMRDARSGIRPLTLAARDTLKVPIGGEVRDFEPSAHFEPKQLMLLDRVSQFALVAAREAVRQSGINFQRDDLGERSAIIVGTGGGGQTSQDQASRSLYGDRDQRVHPLTIVRVMANAPACHISMEFQVTGPTFAISSACASANHALAVAFQMVRSGQVDVAIAGGSEACLTVATIRAWEAMRVLADDACRPFSAARRGLVLAEGAGIFVLEAMPHAQARGARILAEFAGAGLSADAGDIVSPSAQGAARALRAALRDAQLSPRDIDYINAHGTGTIANDATETRALHDVFESHAPCLSISSTKSVHGHALGAAGAIELIAACGALRDGVIPPTANYLGADPQCDLDYTPNVSRARSVAAALSNSFAFGGLNAVLALKRAA